MVVLEEGLQVKFPTSNILVQKLILIHNLKFQYIFARLLVESVRLIPLRDLLVQFHRRLVFLIAQC